MLVGIAKDCTAAAATIDIASSIETANAANAATAAIAAARITAARAVDELAPEVASGSVAANNTTKVVVGFIA